MKIKTITCHDVYNYGATLQAYALMKYLQKKGHEVQIIDYKPVYLSKNNSYNIWRISAKWGKKNFLIKLLYWCLKVPKRYLLSYKGKFAYDKFIKKNLLITKHRFKNNDDLKRKPPEANAYIAGSDQIWNTEFQNGRDPAFYLDFVPDGYKKISYAASFATKEIASGYKLFVKAAVEKIDYVSVREQQGIEILKSVGINRAVCVVDPVFLLNKEDWEGITIPIKETNEKYLLIYEIETNKIIENVAKRLAKENGLLIYAVSCYHPTRYADKDYFNRCGPGTYLTLIKNAEIILSNSFHATAFSIIYEKNFITFNLLKYEINSRMSDLLECLGIKERLISVEQESENLGGTQINYVEVKKKLEKLINNSKSFIFNALC